MALARDRSPPVLPLDVARKIASRITSRDLCNATAACRSFYSWGDACTCVDATLWSRQGALSLLKFLKRRLSSELEVCIHRGLALSFLLGCKPVCYAFPSLQVQRMVLNLDLEQAARCKGPAYVLPLALRAAELCASTLVYLRLEGLHMNNVQESLGPGPTGLNIKVGAACPLCKHTVGSPVT